MHIIGSCVLIAQTKLKWIGLAHEIGVLQKYYCLYIIVANSVFHYSKWHICMQRYERYIFITHLVIAMKLIDEKCSDEQSIFQ